MLQVIRVQQCEVGKMFGLVVARVAGAGMTHGVPGLGLRLK